MTNRDRTGAGPHGAASWASLAVAAVFLLFLCLLAGLSGPVGKHPLSMRLPGSVEQLSLPAGRIILIHTLIWATCGSMLFLFSPFFAERRRTLFILVLAVACRLLLLPQPPSDDVNRYLWEARLVAEGINPYRYAPDAPELAALAEDDPYHAGINHPDMPAAYPPLVQFLFCMATRVSYRPIAIKTLVIMFDMGTLALLLLMLRQRGLSSTWSCLYAFNPVILLSFAGQAHFDAMQSLFLLAAIHLYTRKRWGWMFLFAGLAVQAKYPAIVVLPFLVRRDNRRFAWIAVLAIVLPFAPFAAAGPRWFDSLARFGDEFAFNGFAHFLLRPVFRNSIGAATLVCKLLLGAVLLLGYRIFHPARHTRFRDDPVTGSFYALGALLLLSPTVHFWYLAWVVPFLVLRPTASWMLLCLTSGLYFVTTGIHHHTAVWHLPVVALVLEWLPFYLLFAGDLYVAARRGRVHVPVHDPASVSVVIPTLNEANSIAECIAAVRSDGAVSEVIVVDGGSIDGTAHLARNAGAQVLLHDAPPQAGGGRGGQVAAGVRAASGDVVAIAHADTRIGGAEFSRALRVLAHDRGLIGGAIGSVLDSKGWHLRVLEAGNRFRMIWMDIAFGDQIQFFRREPVVERDLFPAIPLMEDVEMSLRLRRLGRQTFTFGRAVVSARHWQSGSRTRAMLIIRLVGRYLWQRLLGNTDTRQMYERYYGRK